MQYRQLGKSNLQVSALCLGTMMFGDQTGREEAQAIIADAHANGVNYIDTADVYSKGGSERMVGELLKDRRHDWVLATKLGNKMSDRPNEGHFSRSWMLREVDASLQRLQTDHVDILYMHRDNNGMDLEEPLRALDAMLRAGKIRYWGVSNFRGWRIAEIVRVAGQLGMPGPVVCQPYYNLLNRMPEVEILPACEHFGIGVTPYSPVARGVLTGKYSPGQPPAEGTRAARGDKRIAETEFREESLAIAQKLKAHARSEGHHPGAVRDGLGVGAPRGQFGDRGAEDPQAVAGLPARARVRGHRRGRGTGRFVRCARPSFHAGLYRSGLSVAPASEGLDVSVALYWDFENLHASLYEDLQGEGAYGGKPDNRFKVQEPLVDVQAVVDLALSFGPIAINRAYCNWQYFGRYRDALMQNAVDLVQLFPPGGSSKNGADIRLCLDAAEDMARFGHIRTVIVVGGDSDFTPLAQKIRAAGLTLVGVAARKSTNRHWAKSCHEFRYYESLAGSGKVAGDGSS